MAVTREAVLRALQNPAYRLADTIRGLGGHTAGPPPILDVEARDWSEWKNCRDQGRR